MEIGRNYESVRLLGDAKLTIKALTDALLAGDLSKRKATKDVFVKQIQEGREKHLEEIKEVTTSKIAPLRIERFMSAVEKMLPEDAVIVADASFSTIWNATYLSATGDRRFLFPRGLAGLGWGMPMAMGAKLVDVKKKVFCLTGDGGFAHAWSELETCKREGIDVICAVINNTRLGFQYFAEISKFGATTNACDIYDVDYAQVAESCNLTGLTIDKAEDVEAVFQKALEAEGTVVIDVKTDKDCQPPLPFIDALHLAENI